MPVHRVPGPGRGAVFAYADEIAGWLNQQPTDVHGASRSEVRQPATRAGKPWRFVLPVSAVLLVGLIVVWAVRIPGGGQPGPVEKLKFSRTKVQALDGASQQVWEYSIPGSIKLTSEADLEYMENLARIVDLDGDGSLEVLVTSRLEAEGQTGSLSRSVLHCFTSKGELRWKYDPELTLSFAGRSFEGPWDINDVLAVSDGKGHAIWLAVAHHTWWPSFVVKLDAAGKAEVRFVNSGTLKVLNLLRTSDASYMLVGGFNNEWEGGILAVLPVDKAAGSSPQKPGSPYRCDACPSGQPIRYFVFPRSEVNRSEINAINPVEQILITQRKVEVNTGEGPSNVRAFYTFSLNPEMRFVSAAFSDASYWRLHKQLEEEGKIKHTPEQCPERDGPLGVRVWEPVSGWREVRLPGQP
ncbi:MAG: hypothetical protein HYR58_00885 [Acidobacteria bacterium]|nr:hypothetical protein [Acidobacteriota bacterium]